MLRNIALLLLSLQLGTSALAQGTYSISRNYDPAKEKTIEGVVNSFVYRDQARHRPWDVGVHFNLSVGASQDHEAANYFVHVGPKSAVATLIESVHVGDTITVVGSPVQVDGKDGFIAREIIDDGQRITLRDAAGRPVFRNGL